MSSFSQLLKDDGYVVVEDVFSAEDLGELKKEIEKVVDSFDLQDMPKSIFSTYNDDQHISDEYFLNSSDKIRAFFEAGAVDEEGNLKVDKQKAFNKVGHALHWLNPVFRKHTFNQKMKDIFKELGFEDPAVVQSMYIFKQPKIGGAVTDHIDATFLHVSPIEHLIGVWIAVDDATIENGCLSFIPGSHKVNSVDYRFNRTNDTTGGPLLKFRGERPTYDQTKFVPVPIKKGSLILIHGLVVHKSEQNTSELSRHAYTCHVMERKNTKWDPLNWLVAFNYEQHGFRLQETEDYKFPNLYDNT